MGLLQSRFLDEPHRYIEFLDILKKFKDDKSGTTPVVYAEVTCLLGTAPDLVEEFNQFLPDGFDHAAGAWRTTL